MSQEDHPDDLALARAAAKILRQSETVDSNTAQRLAAARQHALSVAGKPMIARRWLVPAGAFAAIALAVMVLRPQSQTAQAPVIANTHGVDALDVLTDDMSPVFYRDLEFYQWLEKEHPHA